MSLVMGWWVWLSYDGGVLGQSENLKVENLQTRPPPIPPLYASLLGRLLSYILYYYYTTTVVIFMIIIPEQGFRGVVGSSCRKPGFQRITGTNQNP
jgi:hypothetical protein